MRVVLAVVSVLVAAPVPSAVAADVSTQLSAGIGAASSFAGGGHTCITTTSGGVRCWGDNATGQLGDGTYDQRSSPVKVSNVSNAVQVASGGDHTCARVTNGDVYCWGDNSFGQIGSDPETVPNSATAIKVDGVTGATSIAAGSQHTCALLADKTVSCWGNGLWGALGVGDANGNSSFTPLAVTGLTDVTQIAAGMSHTCALRGSGSVACWGANDSGQLGLGTLDWMSLPTNVTGLSGVAQLAAGPTSTCAAMSDKTVRCWGDNTFGQIGDGTDSPRLTPTTVSALSGVTSVTVGDSFACARLEGGSVKCWGVTDPRNQWCEVVSGALKNCFSIVEYADRSVDPSVELAVNPAAVSYTPKAIAGILDAAEVSAGDRHLCVLSGTSAVTCLGLNSLGQLGDKSTKASATPVKVFGLGYMSPPPTVTGGAPAAFTKLNTATIAFTGEAKAKFTCSLDGGKSSACTSPLKLKALKDGPHSLSIIQTNQAGVASSATVIAWTVDTKPPTAPALSGTPTPFTNLKDSTIAFTGEPNATYACSIDSGPFNPCSSPTTLNSLTDGAHSLAVKQTDQTGNTGPTATAKWTVDTIAPALTRKVAGYVKRTRSTTTISLVPAKDASGVTSVEYSTSTESPAAGSEPVPANVVKYASPVVIKKSLDVRWLRIRDGAGNHSQWYAAT